MKRLMVLGGMLAVLLIAAAPALAQSATEEAEVTGVISANPEALVPGSEPTSHLITEDGTGDVYMVSSYVEGLDLSQYEGRFVTIYGIFQTQGNPISNFDDLTEVPISVTEVYADYDPAPEAEITGLIQPLAEPMGEGATHTITETETGDVYGLWSDTVDLARYEGKQATIYGIFQTQGGPITGFEDLTDLLIAVTSVEPLEPAPAEPQEVTLNFELIVEGEPPADATFWGQYLVEGASVPLEDQDGDGVYAGSMSGGQPAEGAGFRIVQGTGTEQLATGLYPGEPITVIKDFGAPVVEGDTTFKASVSFDEPPAPQDQHEPAPTDSPDNTPGSMDVLPDTGGFSLVVLGLVVLLLGGGGLLVRGLMRR